MVDPEGIYKRLCVSGSDHIAAPYNSIGMICLLNNDKASFTDTFILCPIARRTSYLTSYIVVTFKMRSCTKL